MKKHLILFLIGIAILSLCLDQAWAQENKKNEQTIFAFGGDISPKFIQYVIDLTNLPNPKICYVPTASADNEKNIEYWNRICKHLSIDPYILKVWVESNPSNKSFEDILLNMDAIIVGGGNTLNMLGIWKAQGIDLILDKALKKGIILAGGSAGSICWFQNGISDARPTSLSVVNGLNYLPYSNCPHYADSTRRELYYQLLIGKKIQAGYACDNLAGVLFKNGKFAEAVTQSDIHNSYYLSAEKGKLSEKKLESKVLINKGALAENDYTRIEVNQKIKDISISDEDSTPLNAFVSLNLKRCSPESNTSEKIKNEIKDVTVYKVLVYNDSLTGIVNKMYSFYGVWYFYKKDGKWQNAGEDIGGDTLFESEIVFREKAKTILKKQQEKNP